MTVFRQMPYLLFHYFFIIAFNQIIIGPFNMNYRSQISQLSQYNYFYNFFKLNSITKSLTYYNRAQNNFQTYPFLMYYKQKLRQQQVINRVDNLVRQNNKKYLDQKSQIQYEKALQQFQKQKQKSLMKQFTAQVKEGNKKAIEKKLKQQSLNKLKNAKLSKNIPNRFSQLQKKKAQEEIQKQIPERQKMNQKQIQKVQKAIQARAQRHLQQLQLEKLNAKLKQQRKKTKLFQLKQTCQKMVSKSHKRIPQISQTIPKQRRILLEQFNEKAKQQVEELDNIISDLIKKSKRNKQNQNQQLIYSQIQKRQKENEENEQWSRMDPFSKEFEVDFIKNYLPQKNDNLKQRNSDSFEDILFTKSASQLFDMKYIPIK